MVGFLAEPVFIVVFLTVSFVAGSTIPYIVQTRWVTPIANFFEPSHVLLMIAFLMLILAEDGRIPVDSPSGSIRARDDRPLEIARIFRSRRRADEMGGRDEVLRPDLHLSQRAGDALGLGAGDGAWEVLLAIPLVLLKVFGFILVLVYIEVVARQIAPLPNHRISRCCIRDFGRRNDHPVVGNLGRDHEQLALSVISALDALTGALFLLTALGVVATRQVLASLQLFIVQSLAADALGGAARDCARTPFISSPLRR